MPRVPFCRYADGRSAALPQPSSSGIRHETDYRSVSRGRFGNPDSTLNNGLLRLDNPDHFNALRAGDVPIWMITNGQLLTPELYERFVVNGPIRSICISIDTVDPVAYTLSRRPGSVAPVIANLETIAKCWPQHCLNKLEAVVTAWNHDKLEPLVHFAAALRVPFVAIDPVRQDLLLRKWPRGDQPVSGGLHP